MQVYAITNDVNDKTYIGACAIPLAKRWSQHTYYARKGCGTSLHADMRKHGIDKFHITRIWSGYISRLNLRRLESYYISSFRTMTPLGYNEVDGLGTSIGRKHSAATIEKCSQSHKGHTYNRGRKHSDQSRINMSRAHIGQVRTPEAQEKFNRTMVSVFQSEEYKAKLSEAQKKAWLNPEIAKKRSEALKASWAIRKNKAC